jgi:hypothetical protein
MGIDRLRLMFAFALYPLDSPFGISEAVGLLQWLLAFGLILFILIFVWVLFWAVLAFIYGWEVGLGFRHTLLVAVAAPIAIFFYLPRPFLEWLAAELAQLDPVVAKGIEARWEIDRASDEYLRRVIELLR